MAHCIEIPSPPKELWKDEEIIAKMMENDKNSFKIPMCVGEVENVEDHNGNISTKVFWDFCGLSANNIFLILRLM